MNPLKFFFDGNNKDEKNRWKKAEPATWTSVHVKCQYMDGYKVSRIAVFSNVYCDDAARQSICACPCM